MYAHVDCFAITIFVTNTIKKIQLKKTEMLMMSPKMQQSDLF